MDHRKYFGTTFSSEESDPMRDVLGYRKGEHATTLRHLQTELAALLASRRPADDAVEKAEKLLNEWIANFDGSTMDEGEGLLFVVAHEYLFRILCRETLRRKDIATKADRIFDDFTRISKKNEHLIEASLEMYNAYLEIWANSPWRESPQRCEFILDLMKQTDTVLPNTQTYQIVMEACLRRDVLDKAVSLLMEILESDHLDLNLVLVHQVLDSMSSKVNHHKGAAAAADKILNLLFDHSSEMFRSSNYGNEANLLEMSKPQYMPTFSTCTRVIAAWTRSRDPEAGTRAEAILKRMERQFQETGERQEPRNQVLLQSVMNAWLSVGDTARAQKYENEILHRLDQVRLDSNAGRDEDQTGPKLDYNMMISTYCRRGTLEGMQKAEEMFDEMMQRIHRGDPIRYPTRTGMNALLFGWAVQVQRNHNPNQEALKKVQHFFQLFESLSDRFPSMRPKREAYNSMITAWSRVGGRRAVEQADKYFHQLRQVYQTTGDELCKPKQEDYNSIMTGWARQGSAEGVNGAEKANEYFNEMLHRFNAGELDCQPTTSDFNTMIFAWSRVVSNRDNYALEMAQQYFNELNRRYKNGDEGCKPTAWEYGAIMTAWSRKGGRNSAETVEKIFKDLEKIYVETGDKDYKPDKSIFGSLISAWGRSFENEEGPKKAEHYFARMQAEWKDKGDESFRPTLREYNVLLDSLIKGRQTEDTLDRVNKVVEEMEVQPSQNCRPNLITYNLLLKAIAKSPGLKDKARRAVELMERVESKEGLELSQMFLYDVLRACAFSPTESLTLEEKRQIMETASMVLRRIRHDYGAADFRTYNRFFQCCQQFGVCLQELEQAKEDAEKDGIAFGSNIMEVYKGARNVASMATTTKSFSEQA